MNNKQEYAKLLDEYNDFINDYKNEILKIIDNIGNLYKQALIKINPMWPEEDFLPIEKKLKKIVSLGNIKTNLYEFAELYRKIEKNLFYEPEKSYIDEGTENEKIQSINNTLQLIEDTLNEVKCLSQIIYDAHEIICEKIKVLLEKIENCPYGQKRKNKRNSVTYEIYVLFLLRWLFIDENVVCHTHHSTLTWNIQPCLE